MRWSAVGASWCVCVCGELILLVSWKKNINKYIKCCHANVSVIVERGRFNYGPAFCPSVLMAAAVMEVTSHSALVLKAPF